MKKQTEEVLWEGTGWYVRSQHNGRIRTEFIPHHEVLNWVPEYHSDVIDGPFFLEEKPVGGREYSHGNVTAIWF